MAIRDSQTGRIWSSRESDGFAALLNAVISKRIEGSDMAQYGRYDVIRYPDGYAVQDMSKDGHPIVFSTKTRELAHKEARRLNAEAKEESHGSD